MDIEDVIKMTPEEFAASWNESDEIIHTCYEALGITIVSDENPSK